MKSAFLIHPITHASASLLESDPHGELRRRWGNDLLGFCTQLHNTLIAGQRNGRAASRSQIRLVDELSGPRSPAGATAEGRLYRIPMNAVEVLDTPSQAINFME